jgi:hypothetical protein
MKQLPFRGLSVKSRRAFGSLQPCLNQVPWSAGQVSRPNVRVSRTTVQQPRTTDHAPGLLRVFLNQTLT